MLVFVTRKPRHIRVLCGGEKLSSSFSHPSHCNRKVLVFAWDVMEVILPPTVKIKEKLWAPTQPQVLK